MNLLNKLTVTNLKLNKKRTTVTIIGIILATALITAVAGMVTSFRETMIHYSKEHDGNYHYEFIDVPKDDLKYIENNRNVESYYITEDIGYARLTKSSNEYKPYLYLMAYDEMALENLSIQLIEGRMPKNSEEIVISQHIIDDAKVDYQIGDKITVETGKRTSGESILTQENPYNEEEETFQKEASKTYEIVGIIERPNRNIEPYSAPGYSVITYLDHENIGEEVNIYTLYTKQGLHNRYQVTADILGISDELLVKIETGALSNEELTELDNMKYLVQPNSSLLSYEALELSESNLSMIYSLAAIIIGIIIVTSIFCIRNSFAISITEKMKQYGMLASVGATSKQIKKNVLYEALILALIGIPLGVLSGILAVFILLKLIEIIMGEYLNGFVFVFEVSWIAILIAVLLSAITIFLSARSSAKRASKISPIEAIRSNEDIKIKSKKIKSPKIIKKLFGMGGEIAYKNLKRNKKKYRTTVISIVVSVSIFIAMSCFMNYAFETTSIYYGTKSYNLIAYGNSLDEQQNLERISQYEGIEAFSLQRNTVFKIKEENIQYSEKGKEFVSSSGNENSENEEYAYIEVISLGRDEYNRYIKELGLSYNDAKDKMILIDDTTRYVTDEEGKGVYQKFNTYTYKQGDKLGVEITNDMESKRNNIEVEIAKVTDKRPMGLEGTYSDYGFIIVSDEWMDAHSDYLTDTVALYIKCNDADQLEEKIDALEQSDIEVFNNDEVIREQNAMWLVIAIFLYGFIAVISLIGITNIFNTITTNMNLRSKEFANLKSIGMTKKEFNRMIRLESIFYGTKSLIIGIPIGIGLSYAIYKAFAEGTEMGFLFPTSGVIISIVAVFVLIIGIMKYSLNKINKQNIIETIRKDNI